MRSIAYDPRLVRGQRTLDVILKLARYKCRLTIHQAAFVAGVRKSDWRHWESGFCETMRLSDALSVAIALEMSCKELLAD
jgi:hypothetical protein